MYIKKRNTNRQGRESIKYPYSIKIGDVVELEVSPVHTGIDGVRRITVDRIYYRAGTWRATGLVFHDTGTYRVSKCVKYCRKIK